MNLTPAGIQVRQNGNAGSHPAISRMGFNRVFTRVIRLYTQNVVDHKDLHHTDDLPVYRKAYHLKGNFNKLLSAGDIS